MSNDFPLGKISDDIPSFIESLKNPNGKVFGGIGSSSVVKLSELTGRTQQ